MIILFYLLGIAMLILFPDNTAQTALNALLLWGNSIVPTLFPYMILSRLLCRRLCMLHLPSAAATAVLGMLGGSPSGSALLASGASSLSKRDFIALCALSGTISPIFILGTLRTWTQHAALCSRLLVCHWLSALLCAWIVRRFCHSCKQQTHTSASEIPTTGNPVSQSIDAILHVGGYIILYSVIAGMMGQLLQPVFPALTPMLHAFLEVSGGIHAILSNTNRINGMILCAFLGFSGLSIISQNYTMLRHTGIKMRQLICFGFLRAMLSALAFLLSSMLFPIN
ncbi:MAG: hypothetical protein IKU38_03280 [Clostridia bacterium]|nr:hypothetical protein [Clostridia bacterium]